MDEVLFHASQRLEAFQLHVYSGMQQSRHLLQNYSEQLQGLANSPVGIQVQDGVQHVWQWLLHFRDELRSIINFRTNPEEAYAQLLHFLGIDTGGIGVYYGCIGFILGGAVGVTLGLSWQRSVQPWQKMKAIVCNGYRGLDALAVTDDAPCPTIRNPDELLIQVKAASVDMIDVNICWGYGRVLRKHLGKYDPNVRGEFPITLGRDCSGIIVEIGQKVVHFEIGDEVWFTVPHWVSGTLSEYVVVKQSLIAKKPKGVGFEAAASLPYSGMIAWDAMVHQAGLNSKTTRGRRVLVHSGCSPVGCVLLQLTHLWGAFVSTTCSLRAIPVAQALGADHVIVCDGDVEKQIEHLEPFDIVFNTVGTVAHETCLRFCQPGGRVITTIATPISSDTYGFVFGSIYLLWMGVKCMLRRCVGASTWSSAHMSPFVLNQLGSLVENGSLQPVVDKIFAPQDAELAFQHVDSGETIGKTIIRFRSRNTVRKRQTPIRKRINGTASM